MDATDGYTIQVFGQEGGAGYIAVCCEFPGVLVLAQTRAGVIKAADAAIELAIKAYDEAGWPLPEPGKLDARRRPDQPNSAPFNRDDASQNHLIVGLLAAALAGGESPPEAASAGAHEQAADRQASPRLNR